ncbi:MAG TPA: DUF1329 domain-containing protein [Candidatus Binataceae bacterium]|nr:DUF1329 domain-containing protein [Candidatus Binataceae bacterium]
MGIAQMMRRITWVIAVCLTAGVYFAGTGICADAQPSANGATASTIAPGTVITTANWQQYRSFMPDGMAALFEGKYFWKMPADLHIEIGPTAILPLPKNYLAATEKYAPQVRLVELPDGGLSLDNYHGGIPFPNPAEPHKGWKVLANVWYRYIPHLVVDTYGSGCAIDSTGNYNCHAYLAVKRQLAYNTDTNAPVEPPGPNARYFTEWFMTLEPEQEKYTAYLTVNYADPTRPEDEYAFLPALRRYQPISSAARCSETGGMDDTFEDFHNGFDSNLTQLDVEYLGHRKIIALVDPHPPTGPFPADVDMPLGWPTPKWGTWQVRDVDVLGIKKLPSKSTGYCYGRRVVYADSNFSSLLWEDLDDMHMQPWKMLAIFPLKVDVPQVGPVNTAALDVEVMWDLQRKHATYASEPASGHPYYINEQAPREYHDDTRYATPAGLNMIMR